MKNTCQKGDNVTEIFKVTGYNLSSKCKYIKLEIMCFTQPPPPFPFPALYCF